MMTSDAGRTWSVRCVGLPISADDYGASLMAADARDAVLNISPPMAEPRALLTSDGGASWAQGDTQSR